MRTRLALAAGFVIVACASSKSAPSTSSDLVVPKLDAAAFVADPGPPPQYANDAIGRYTEGMDQMRAQRWDDAAATFNDLKVGWAYSKYAQLAELRLADIAFAKSDYATAARLYQQWAHDHPREDVGPLVRRAQLALCHQDSNAACGDDTYDAGL